MPANSFYNHSSSIAAGATAKADQVRGEFDEVAAGFELVEAELNKGFRFPSGAGKVFTESSSQRASTVVGFNASGDPVLTSIGSFKSAWVAATAYKYKDIVQGPSSHGFNLYICEVPHTSGTFATDLAANKWVLFADLRLVVNELKTASFTAVAGGDYMIDSDSYSAGAPLEVTLPASPAITDAPITITLVKGDASEVKIMRNGKLIMGLTEDMVVNVQYASFKMMFCNDALGWRLSNL